MIKPFIWKMCTVSFAVLLLAATLPAPDADARAGGGRSSGSRGTRSYSPPSRSYSQPAAPDRSVLPSSPAPMAPRPAPSSSGGFFRSFAGGMLGGLVGGMLFRSLGFGGGAGGGFGGSGIGLFEIILVAGICYFIYRMVARRRNEASYQQTSTYSDYSSHSQATAWQPSAQEESDVATGLAHIRQMDYSFDESKFKDQVMDIFFKIQGAWMNRNLSGITPLLTDEMRRNLQEDVDRLLREKRINRLENIAVRSVDITEAWQESGQDYITALIYANLLDYTVDEAGGSVVAGSNLEPVKFEEYWTFTRPVGNNGWKLSAIDQK